MKTPVELRRSRFADVYDVLDAEGLEVCVSATYDRAAELVKIINAHETLVQALESTKQYHVESLKQSHGADFCLPLYLADKVENALQLAMKGKSNA